MDFKIGDEVAINWEMHCINPNCIFPKYTICKVVDTNILVTLECNNTIYVQINNKTCTPAKVVRSKLFKALK